MPRWARGWPEALKARAARYALQLWLGPFLEEPLRLEQLGLDLRGGTGSLRELRLRAAVSGDITGGITGITGTGAVDELLAGAGVPLELREGGLGAVTVTVPWAQLGSEPVRLRLQRLRLVLRPRESHRGTRARRGPQGRGRPPRGGSQQGRDPPQEPPPLEGLEALAVTIDTVLRRLQVLLEDTKLRLELPPRPGGGPGGALELHLPRVEYEDSGGGGGPPAVLHKGLRLCDLRLLWQELPPAWAQVPVSPPVLAALLPGPSELSLRLKQNENVPGPGVELEGKVGALHLLLPPPLLGILRGLLGALDPPGPPPCGRSRPLGPQDLALIERELSRGLRGGRDPPSPPGGDPDSELFYSMTGSLGGGDSAAPPEETPTGSPSPSPAGSPRNRRPSPHSCAPPGRGPPFRGSLRLQVTLGTVTALLPELGGAPSPAHQRLWAELCHGHAQPAWDHALPFPHLRSCVSPPPRMPAPPPPSPCSASAGAPPAPPPPGPRPCPRAPPPRWSWGCS
ncbi:autophagy-related protein 2 homolog A-like [Molothrus ater]|uniref:autophagy-related protein 2 homolog A-like n=1 Tax=Molothrus ater TaxID=84834 RepID=UPI0023E7EBA8|nr:autophagy-related protein 2 homolog A-like [Molothrus ater]